MINITVIQGMPDDMILINAPMLPDGSALDWAEIKRRLDRQQAYGEPVPWHAITLTNSPEIYEEPPAKTTACPECGEPQVMRHSGVTCSSPTCNWWHCT